ncbi:hypothetical protein ACT2FY_32275 [Paraburkholderia fungorum]|uniref:hypothetical protein n=1 Tax=Paraburkholderia fungorum TaxID=134537 RepID=UPI00402B5CE6
MSSYFDTEIVPPVKTGIDADWLGPMPRESFSVGEKEQFQGVRDRLDRVLQVTRVVPSYPQQHHTPQSYEEGLLAEVAKHSEKFTTFDRQHGPLLRKYAPQIIQDAMNEPHRLGILREIKMVDRSGREISEFVGDKSGWLGQFKGPMLTGPICIDGQPQRV